MATTFSHPKTLLSRHRRNTRLRLLLWALIGIPFWFFGLRMLLQGDGYAGVVFATVFTVLKMGFEIFFFAGSREILRLARTSVVLDGSRLEQRDENEVPLATISLDRPFDPGFYFNVLGQVVYRVEQAGTVLKFAAAIENAERLVKEVLASPDKWPPEIPEPKSGPSHYHAQAGR